MKTRVITGIILVLVLVPLFVLGGLTFNILLLLLTLGAVYEIHRLFIKEQSTKKLIIFVGIEMVIATLFYYLLQLYYVNPNADFDWFYIGVTGIIVIGALLYLFIDKITVRNYAIVYPAIGFAAIYAIRDFGLNDIGFLFMITIFTDVFAYVVGINFGKHRLAEKISPKKSVEGSIGGTFFAIVFTLIYLWVFNVNSIVGIELNIFISISLIFVLSIIGQMGDLIASKLKRANGIKDFSNLLPGHGGIMDRFDSVLYAALVLILIGKIVGM